MRHVGSSCRHYPDGQRRWRVAIHSGSGADFVLCALMDTDNARIRCYVLLATAGIGQDSLFLSERTLVRYAAHCYATLDEVFGMDGVNTA